MAQERPPRERRAGECVYQNFTGGNYRKVKVEEKQMQWGNCNFLRVNICKKNWKKLEEFHRSALLKRLGL